MNAVAEKIEVDDLDALVAKLGPGATLVTTPQPVPDLVGMALEAALPAATPTADSSASVDQFAAAEGYVRDDDPLVIQIAESIKQIVGVERENATLFKAEVTPQVVADLLAACGIEGTADTHTGYVTSAIGRAYADFTKKAKRSSGGTASSSSRAPRASGSSGKPKELVAVKGYGILVDKTTLQDRTQAIELPETIRWESTSQRGTKNRHQLDFSRTEGYAPMMPDAEFMAQDNNPYTFDVSHEKVRPNGGKWRPYVKVSYFTYERLKVDGQITVPLDPKLVEEIAKQASIPVELDVAHCIVDTLRDLWTCYYVDLEAAGRTRVYKMPTPSATA